MKKLVWVLCLGVLLGAFPIAGVAQTSQGDLSDDLDENLIVHFDFETTNETGRPLDISAAGDTKETLYIPETKDADGNPLTYLSDGVAHVSAAAGSYLSLGAFGDDVKACTEMTVFVAFQAKGTPTGSFANVLDMNNVLRPYITTDGLFVRATDAAYKNNNVALIPDGHPVAMDQYIWAAFALRWDQAAATLYCDTYVSVDAGQTYTRYSTTHSGVNTMFSNCNSLYLGKLQNGNAWNKDGILGFDFDDFRIYNQSLTQEEVERIQIEKTPANVCTQERVRDGVFDVRFCAVIDSLDYSEVGFEIVAVDADGTELNRFRHASSQVYESVLALGEPVTAQELGGKYLIAYAILDIPDDLGTVVFQITPYAVRNGITYFGDTLQARFEESARVTV